MAQQILAICLSTYGQRKIHGMNSEIADSHHQAKICVNIRAIDEHIGKLFTEKLFGQAKKPDADWRMMMPDLCDAAVASCYTNEVLSIVLYNLRVAHILVQDWLWKMHAVQFLASMVILLFQTA